MPRVFYEEESDEEPQVPVAAAAAMGGQQSTSDDDDVVMTFDNAAAAGYLPSNFAKDVNRRERARMVMMESPVFMGDLRKDGKRPDGWAERIPATMVQSAAKRHKARMAAPGGARPGPCSGLDSLECEHSYENERSREHSIYLYLAYRVSGTAVHATLFIQSNTDYSS